jgi:hypothetical protein
MMRSDLCRRRHDPDRLQDHAGRAGEPPGEWSKPVNSDGLSVALVSFLFLNRVLMRTDLIHDGLRISTYRRRQSAGFFSIIHPSFELISLLIVVAIIGNIMLALLSKEKMTGQFLYNHLYVYLFFPFSPLRRYSGSFSDEPDRHAHIDGIDPERSGLIL